MDRLCTGKQFKASTSAALMLTPLLQYALVFIPGLVVGRIFDMGYVKAPLGGASALLVAVTFLTAQCTQYWQFLLCQGIALGVRLFSNLYTNLIDSCYVPAFPDCVRSDLWDHYGLSCALV